MSIKDKILAITRQMYPSGRAFKMPEDSEFEKMHNGLAASEERAYQDATAILYSILPDNNNFTVDDATDWEHRLGLITNPLVPLADRKLAILRKMNHPGTVPARENFRFLEKQLQDAGFAVFVYENRFPDGMGGYITMTAEDVSGTSPVSVQHGDIQHGDAQHGGGNFELVVNYIDPALDAVFNIGTNLRSTFFIGGDPLGTFADVDAQRRDEFRQIILKTKPVQTVAILFINYV